LIDLAPVTFDQARLRRPVSLPTGTTVTSRAGSAWVRANTNDYRLVGRILKEAEDIV
jgi:hypothetical protein